MARQAVVRQGRSLSRCAGARGAGAVGLAKLTEGPLHLPRKIPGSLAIPAHVDLIEGGAIERRSQVTTSGIAAIGLSFRQFFSQGGYPAAESAQKATAKIRRLKHQIQHLPGLAGVMHFFLHHRENGTLQRRQRLAAPGRCRKPLRHPFPEVLHAEGEQFFLGAEIAEKGAPGDARVAADFLHRSPVETDGGKQIPGGPLNLSKDELVFPFAKRPGILKFRPLFAAGRTKRFLHSMQIMAQSAIL
jgi:hypothetical protein